jgi:hypothetical protein
LTIFAARTITMKTFLIAFLLFLAHNGAPAAAPSASDSQQDFNWELGNWDTKLRRLSKPLSGSQEWLEYTGTTVVTPLMSNLMSVAPPGGSQGFPFACTSRRAGNGACISRISPTA